MKKRTLLLTLAALLAATTISANNSLPFTAAVKESGMWGAVNAAGKVVIPISYDRLGLSLSEADEQAEDLLSEEGRDDLIEAEKGGLRGFFTRTGKEVVWSCVGRDSQRPPHTSGSPSPSARTLS